MTGPVGPIGYTGDQGAPGSSSGQVLYFNYNQADPSIANYSDFSLFPQSASEVALVLPASPTPLPSPPSTPFLIGSFITPVGYPNVTAIPPGTIDFNIFSQLTGSGTGYIYVAIYMRDIAGLETLFQTSVSSNIMTAGTIYQSDLSTTINSVYAQFSTADRLVVKIWGVRLTGDLNTKIVTYFYGASHYSHVHTTFLVAVPGVVFLPATGTTTTVNLSTALAGTIYYIRHDGSLTDLTFNIPSSYVHRTH